MYLSESQNVLQLEVGLYPYLALMLQMGKGLVINCSIHGRLFRQPETKSLCWSSVSQVRKSTQVRDLPAHHCPLLFARKASRLASLGESPEAKVVNSSEEN